MLKNLIHNMRLDIRVLKLLPHLPGANELMACHLIDTKPFPEPMLTFYQ